MRFGSSKLLQCVRLHQAHTHMRRQEKMILCTHAPKKLVHSHIHVVVLFPCSFNESPVSSSVQKEGTDVDMPFNYIADMFYQSYSRHLEAAGGEA